MNTGDAFYVSCGITLVGILAVANFSVGRKQNIAPPTAQPLQKLVHLVGQRIDVARWQAESIKVPPRFFVLPRCAFCSKTPPDMWPVLMAVYTGAIVSPNYATEWPSHLRGWAKKHSVIYDPDGHLIPTDAYDKGPIDIAVDPDSKISSQSFGWPNGGL